MAEVGAGEQIGWWWWVGWWLYWEAVGGGLVDVWGGMVSEWIERALDVEAVDELMVVCVRWYCSLMGW